VCGAAELAATVHEAMAYRIYGQRALSNEARIVSRHAHGGEIALAPLGVAGAGPLDGSACGRGGDVARLARDHHNRLVTRRDAVDAEGLRRAAAVDDENVHACTVVLADPDDCVLAPECCGITTSRADLRPRPVLWPPSVLYELYGVAVGIGHEGQPGLRAFQQERLALHGAAAGDEPQAADYRCRRPRRQVAKRSPPS